jgi:antitoxin component YwqK of YwqJK toxin-antitoxin module
MNQSDPKKMILRRLVMVGVVALVVVGALLLFRFSRPLPIPELATVPEYPRAELHLRDGRLYRDVETNAFTGWMLEHYEDGALRSRSAISNGLLHGLSEGWYTNGQMQVSESFRDGISHGLRAKWSASGAKLSEGHIVEGKFDGPFRKWHENGMLAEQVEFTDGQPVGVSLAYFPSGFLKARVRLQAGAVAEQQFWQDGEADKLVAGQEQTP